MRDIDTMASTYRPGFALTPAHIWMRSSKSLACPRQSLPVGLG